MTTISYTADQIQDILDEARQHAYQAAGNFFQDRLNGVDQYPCGFAWVNINGVKGNTRTGRALAQAGVRKSSYYKAFQIWNPSGFPVQNVDVLEAGARAAAEVFQRYGFDASAGSRLD